LRPDPERRMTLCGRFLGGVRHLSTTFVPLVSTTNVTLARRWNKEAAFKSEFYNPVADALYGADKWSNERTGHIYDKKPWKVKVKKYHLYDWCGCGRSHSQPFCDHYCKTKTNIDKGLIVGGPVKYVAPEDREVWFCNCKQTQHRPFCDGSHRHPDIQAMKIEGKFNLWDPTSDVKVDQVVESEDDISDDELLYGDLIAKEEEEKAKAKK